MSSKNIKTQLKKASTIVTNSYVAAVAQSSDDEVAVFKAPCAGKIVEVGIIPDAAVTGAATDNYTLSCQNKGAAGTGTDVICSKAYTLGVDSVQYDYESLGTLANNVLAKDDTVTFLKTEAASGLAMPAMVVVIEFLPDFDAVQL